MNIPTRRRVRNVFYTASHRGCTTSLKPLADKPVHKQTSCKDKQKSLGACSRPFLTELIVFVDQYQKLGSRIRIHITLYKLQSHPICHSFHSSKMTGTHQEQLIDQLRFFIEFNFLLCKIFSRHRRQQNPTPAQLASPSPQPPRRRRKPQNPWVMPWILQREENGCYRSLLDELITTEIPGYRNFTRMKQAFFYLIEKGIIPHLRKSITTFRKPLEVGLKLAVTLRHLSTGESYTLLEYQCRAGRTTNFKFVPQVCKAILKEFQHEYLLCPTEPDD